MDSTDIVVLVNSDHADTPYDEWTEDTGIRPWLLVSEERYDSYRHLTGRLPGLRCYPGPWAGNLRVELDALELAREVSATAIVARSEPDILRAARLREALGLPGQGWDSALAFRDKVVMKRLAAQHGLPVATFAELATGTDLVRFVETHGFPVVVKPTAGSGSYDTRVLWDRADLLAQLDRGMTVPMKVERFVDGVMYHVDGLVVGGNIVAIHPSRYVNDCLSFQAGEHLGGYMLTTAHPMHGRMVGFAAEVLRALPTPQVSTFHIEVFHTPGDELVFCEAASRCGGVRIPAALRHAVGIDLEREWFNAQVGLAPASHWADCVRPGRTAGYAVFYPRTGTLLSLPEQAPPSFVVDARASGQIGRRYAGGYKSGHFIDGFVLEGESERQIETRIGELAAWYGERVRWS